MTLSVEILPVTLNSVEVAVTDSNFTVELNLAPIGAKGDIGEVNPLTIANAAASAVSATNAANSATASANSATASAASASTSSTKAAEASVSQASALTSANNAASSAATSTTQAGIATTKADEASESEANSANSAISASNSATASANSATESAGSATEAAGSASSTAALLATFRSVFLGSFASDSAAATFASANSILLVDGVMYENTTGTPNKFRIYNGTTWDDYDSTAQASQSAAALSAANAASSAATASTQAGIATTQAGNAASSAASALTAKANAETAEANAEIAEASASASAGVATTQATNSSNSAAAAAISESSAASSAGAAAISETNSANSADSASDSAIASAASAASAATSETNSASSASDSADSASTSTAQAAIATAQAVAAETAKTGAETAEINSYNSAASATTQAGIATTQATASAASASSASASASNAAASAAAAAASYDSFDDRYLGVKTSEPTLDNDGNALVTGALYYNDGTVTSDDKGMWVYDGSVWIAASAASTAILTVFKYTATAAQTTFTGADNNSLTLTYTAGSVIVTVNGSVIQVGTDVNATTGTSIVLSQAALAGDEVNIYAFATFNLADVYTKPESDLNYLPKVNPSYTGTLTGGTGVVNLGSGQFYKDANGNIGIGTGSPSSYAGYTAVTQNGTNGVEYDFKIGGTLAGYIELSSTLFKFDAESTRYFQWVTNGSEKMRITSAGKVNINQTAFVGWGNPNLAVKQSASAPYTGILVESSTNGNGTYMGHTGSVGVVGVSYDTGSFTPLTFQTSGSEVMRIDTSGNVGIGTSSPAYRLDVQLAGACVVQAKNTLNAGDAQFKATNTAGTTLLGRDSTGTYIWENGAYPIVFFTSATERMRIDSLGSLLLGTTSNGYGVAGGIYAPEVYGYTTGAAANMVIENGGFFRRSTSSLKYKKEVQDSIHGLADVMKLRSVTYKGKSESDGDKVFGGLIAEEVDAVGLTEFVTYAEDGSPDALAYGQMVSLAFKAIQELKAELDATKAEVAALKGTI